MVNKTASKKRNGSVMKIVICDDNLAFAKDLYRKIHLCCAKKEWKLECEIYSSPLKLMVADLSSVQVAFLDIDMPGINGIEAAQELRKKYPDLVLVFVTAWIEYAPEGYCVNALRYLLKSRISQEIEPCMDAVREKLYENKDTIRIEQKERTIEIAIKDILYFEGTSKRAVLVHTRTSAKEGIECVGKLSDYESLLAEKGFLRLQRSYIVNMAHINKIRNYIATLDNGVELKASEKCYSDICKQYVMWRGQKI